ncbi:MAG: carboxypeptidase-like regulatory domain-containing protein, partial [Bacteroidales bacterium]|nr:carboxypeptidase-like regulatory domain-containing protein [Bacteroidales bacterium]
MKQMFLKSVVFLLASAIGLTFDAMAQSRIVTGTVIDETGEPMIGLTVIVTGTTTGSTTDIDGRYRLSVPEGGSLTFSYLGYETA